MSSPQSYVTYTGDGATKQYDLTFGYLRQSHVFAFVNDQLTEFKWVGPTRIELPADVAVGIPVKIVRLTDRVNRLTTFADGQTLLSEDLNAADLQNFYILQEVADQIADGVLTGSIPINNAGSGYITEQWIAAQLETNIAASAALQLLQQDIDDEAAARVAAIASEAATRAQAILDEAQTRATETGALDTRITDLETTVDDPTTGLSVRTGSLEGRMTTVENGKAELADFNVLDAQVNDPTTGVIAEANALDLRVATVESGKAEVSVVNAISARVDDVEVEAGLYMNAFTDGTNPLVSVALIAAANGSDPAAIELRSGNGSQVLLTGNTLIEGNLLVDGSIVGGKMAVGTITADKFSSNMGNFSGAIRVGVEGSTTDVAFMAGSGYSTTHRIWAGDENPLNAPFQVKADGALIASKLSIVSENGDLVFSSQSGFSDYGKNLILINTGNFVNPVVTSLTSDTDEFDLTYLQTTDVQLRGYVAPRSEAIGYNNGQSVPATTFPNSFVLIVEERVDGVGGFTTLVSKTMVNGTHYTIEQTIVDFGGGGFGEFDKLVIYEMKGKAPYTNDGDAIVFPDDTNSGNEWQDSVTITGPSKVHTYRVRETLTSSGGRSLSVEDTNPGLGFLVDDLGASAPGNLQDADLLNAQPGSYYLDYSNFTNTPTIPTNNNQLTNGAGYATVAYVDAEIAGVSGGGGGLSASANETITGDWDFQRNTAGLLRYTFQNTNNAAQQQTDLHIATTGTTPSDLYIGVNYASGNNTFQDSRPASGGDHEFRFEGALKGWYNANDWTFSNRMLLGSGATGDLALGFSARNQAGMWLDTANGNEIVFQHTASSIEDTRIRDGSIEVGKRTGGVAMTVNDGYGNANLTFNHNHGTPGVTGSSGRFEQTADSSTAIMYLELKDSVTQNVPVSLSIIQEWRTAYIRMHRNVLHPDGSPGSPSMAFASDTDTGFYLNAAGDVSVAAGGAQVASFRSDRLYLPPGTDLVLGNGSGDTTITVNKADNNVADHIQFQLAGTALGEIGGLDTGWLRINQHTSKNIYTPRYIRADGGFFIDGTTYGISGSGYMRANPGSAAAPGLSFGGDTNTGFYRKQSDQIGISAGGVYRGHFGSGGLFMNEVSLTSDARLKDNVKDIPYGLSAVLQLSPKWYTRNDMGDKPEIGLIAQEVQKVIPEVVSVGADDDRTLSVAYPKLVALLTKSIQELSEKNDNLEARIERMEALIGKLST